MSAPTQLNEPLPSAAPHAEISELRATGQRFA